MYTVTFKRSRINLKVGLTRTPLSTEIEKAREKMAYEAMPLRRLKGIDNET